MPDFFEGMIVGGVLMLALLFFIGSVIDWRTKRRERDGWCERRSRKTYRPLPGPDMTEDEAKHFANHVRFHNMPGQRNGALVNYLTGKHDAVRMERLLDERFGFGDCAYNGYERGKLIAEHEEGCRAAAQARQRKRWTRGR